MGWGWGLDGSGQRGVGLGALTTTEAGSPITPGSVEAHRERDCGLARARRGVRAHRKPQHSAANAMPRTRTFQVKHHGGGTAVDLQQEGVHGGGRVEEAGDDHVLSRLQVDGSRHCGTQPHRPSMRKTSIDTAHGTRTRFARAAGAATWPRPPPHSPLRQRVSVRVHASAIARERSCACVRNREGAFVCMRPQSRGSVRVPAFAIARERSRACVRNRVGARA